LSRAEAVAITVHKISQTLWQLPTKAFHVAVVDVLADAAETHAKVLRAFFPGLRWSCSGLARPSAEAPAGKQS